MSRVQHAILEINSDDRVNVSETPSNFTWRSKVGIRFPIKVNGISSGEWIYSVRPENILIPNSFYNVNSKNNTLSITETGGGGGGGTFSITIGQGNYSIVDFISELTDELDTASVASGDTNTYLAVFDNIQGKLTYSYTGTSTSVQFNDSGSTSFPILGLNTGTNHSFTVASPLISQKVSFLNKIRFLGLNCSGDLSLSNHFDKIGLINRIARVPILSDSFTDNFIPNDRGSNFYRINPRTINTLQFQLLDEDGDQIDLNGEEFQFDLVFYKRRGR